MIYGRKWREYASQWDTMIIKPERVAEAVRAAQYAIANKSMYQSVQDATGVPWPMTACDHRRESDAEDKYGNPLFTSYLGNGQPLNRVTTIVPKDRGPFHSFLEGAKDAYAYDHMDKVIDWRLEKMLFWLEGFNGEGYHLRRLPSPYLWGGTNIQKKGKYIADHKWSPNALDKQLGVAPILVMITKYDPTVVYVRED